MLPKPYYDEDGITIYNADCRDILPHLPKVDLVLTDPPYGIADIWKGGASSGWGNAKSQTEERNIWDAEAPTKEVFEAIISQSKYSVIWGGNYFELPVSRGWLVWNKPERNFSLAEAELAWTNKSMVIRVFDNPRSDFGRQHPTQKPLKVMSWCLSFFPEAKTVLDPFMGSGTTLVAAKNLGMKAIGIEISEEYCRIAVERLAQKNLFAEVTP